MTDLRAVTKQAACHAEMPRCGLVFLSGAEHRGNYCREKLSVTLFVMARLVRAIHFSKKLDRPNKSGDDGMGIE